MAERKKLFPDKSTSGGQLEVIAPAIENTTLIPFYVAGMSDKDSELQIKYDETIIFRQPVFAYEEFQYECSVGLHRDTVKNKDVTAIITDSTALAYLNLGVLWDWGV